MNLQEEDRTRDMSLQVERVGVVGGGTMGAGIAEVCARVGLEVSLVETDRQAIGRARKRIETSLARGVKSEKLGAEEAERINSSVRGTTDFDAMADREVIIEAVLEDKSAKLDVFKRLAEVVTEPEVILASNTSSIPIVELANSAGDRSEQVLGLHFFNPVPVLTLVEVIPSLLTSEAVAEKAQAFVSGQLGKDPVVAPDRAGFTVNALLIPYLLSAIRMLDQGLASAQDIDTGMVKGCAHPLGPLALADLIGLDTVMSVAETLYAEHREQLFAPPPLLRRLVSAGLLGRKTGRGLYSYKD